MLYKFSNFSLIFFLCIKQSISITFKRINLVPLIFKVSQCHCICRSHKEKHKNIKLSQIFVMEKCRLILFYFYAEKTTRFQFYRTFLWKNRSVKTYLFFYTVE